MCGRFTLSVPPETLAPLFDLPEPPDWPPRFNIAPSQPVPTVLAIVGGPGRRFKRLRWGLVPHWAEEARVGARMINARSETVHQRPAFRDAFRHRRCLIVADGFYEWQSRPGGGKQPHYIRMPDGRPFAFAGLWDRWEGPNGEVVESCAILTTEANEAMRPLHDRMPVIVRPEDYDAWLDPGLTDPDQLLPILQRGRSDDLTAYPVSTFVNNPVNDSPRCIRRLPSDRSRG